MNTLIAYCGLSCDTCSIYLATRETDSTKQKKLRIEIARLCREHYGKDYSPEDISDCDGCRTEGGRLFSGCRNCLIRKCAIQRGYENCAWCDEYVCEKLNELFVMDPSAKSRLDKIRNSLKQKSK
jgi:hypothetical protein